VLDFVSLLGLSLLAALLTVTGIAHAGRPGRLIGLLQQHRLVPRPLVAPVAVAVPVAELALAAAAVVALVGGRPGPTAVALAGGLGAGLAFAAYLGRLMASGSDADCGCTPLEAPLTSASFAPAASLIVACGLGLAAGAVGGSGTVEGSAWSLLPVLWGPVLALLVVLAPATVPVAASHRSRGSRPVGPRPVGPRPVRFLAGRP
jgi:hypothetical protein